MTSNGFLGIDASKGYSDFVLLDGSLQALSKPIQFDDTRRGHRQLSSWLNRQIEVHNLDQVWAGVESTGGFEDNWHARLIELGNTLPVKIARLNPLGVKHAAKATLPDQVTDAQSAYYIAAYLRRYREKVSWQQPETKYRSFRSFDGHIRLLVKQRSQLISQFKQLLYSCFPELQRFCKDSIPNWVLELLTKYPTPQKLARARPTTVAKINYVSLEKAQRLVDKAKQSVAGRAAGNDGILMASMASQIQVKQRHIAKLKKKLTQKCQGPETELLETIPGIATYSAVALMIQIENIRRFATPGKLAGYFGVYPAIRVSGDKKPVVRMSKKGRAQMRATLYMCAGNAVLHDEHLKGIYHKHRGKGKSHKQALGVLMHKLLRIIWGMLTRQTAYNADKDRSNQQKNNRPDTNSQQNELESKRRLQAFDQDAPISRVASKKRKAYQHSQVSKAEQMRDVADTPPDKHTKNVCQSP
jgi:transposase